MKLTDFFARHTIFTFDEITAFTKARSSSTLYNLLRYHVKRRNIIRLRRGMYYVIPKGIDPNACPIDPFLVASKMANDAILGYRTALDLHGKLHSTENEFIYITKTRESKPFTIRDISYRAVSPPTALKRTKQEMFGVQSIDRLGEKILVTNLERTFVDVLDRPYLCGSWEEIWRSLASIEFLDLEYILQYALLLDNATTIAKIGFFLDVHRDRFLVEQHWIEKLKKYKPKMPHYLERGRKKSLKMISEWNLIIPVHLLNRVWEESHENI